MILVLKSHIILIVCVVQLINQFHHARKVNSNVVVLTIVFLRVKFVMHTKIAQMVKMNPFLVVSVAEMPELGLFCWELTPLPEPSMFGCFSNLF